MITLRLHVLGAGAAGVPAAPAAAVVAPLQPAQHPDSGSIPGAGALVLEDDATPHWAHMEPELGYSGAWHYNWSKPNGKAWKDFCTVEVRTYEGGFQQGKCAAAAEHVYLLFTSCPHHVYLLFTSCLPLVYILFTSYLHLVYLSFTSCLPIVYLLFT